MAFFNAHSVAAAPQTPAPSFQESDCWFKSPDRLTIKCGFLDVPERYDDQESRRLMLPVLILNADLQATSSKKPLLYIEGGPGSDAGVTARKAGRNWHNVIEAAPFLQDRPIIVMAQRGTGDETSMYLRCPDLGDPRIRIGLSSVPRSIGNAEKAKRYALADCKAKAAEAGYDLRAYTTANAVRDYQALQPLLGISTWDIFAHSYGSRVAIMLAAEDETGISRLILDGPDLPGSYASFEVGRWLKAAFTQLQKDCNTIKRCKEHFPKLEALAIEAVQGLSGDGEWVGFRRGDNQVQYLHLTKERALNTLYNAFYNVEAIRLLPRALYRAKRGDYSVFGALSGSLLLDPFFEARSYGMAFSVDCGDFDWSKARSVLTAEKQKFPHYAALVDARLDSIETLCPHWLGEDYETCSSPPKVIDIPTLFLSGVYDPVTPVKAVKDSPITFTQAYYISIPAMGHGVTFTDACANSMVYNFLETPEAAPNRECLKDIEHVPDFVLDRSPPPPEPFIEMKTYGDSLDRRIQ